MPQKTPQELTLAEIVALMDGQLRPDAGGKQAYLPSPMVQNHAAFLAFLPGGDLACAWFGGTMEGRGDISIWMARLAPGATTWSPRSG